MAHFKRILFVIIALVFAQTAFSEYSGVMQYETSLKKWRNDKILHYIIKVNYIAFSPVSGLWEVEVKNGIVVSFKFNGSGDSSYLKSAGRFTMESLYKMAAPPADTGSQAPMIINAEYDRLSGYIKSISRIRNPSYTGRAIKDAGFSIKVVELTQCR